MYRTHRSHSWRSFGRRSGLVMYGQMTFKVAISSLKMRRLVDVKRFDSDSDGSRTVDTSIWRSIQCAYHATFVVELHISYYVERASVRGLGDGRRIWIWNENAQLASHVHFWFRYTSSACLHVLLVQHYSIWAAGNARSSISESANTHQSPASDACEA